MARKNHVSETPATQWLRAQGIAFTEHVYGLPPLPGGEDATAYDYLQSFDFSQQPQPPIALSQHPVPITSIHLMATLPPDPSDPDERLNRILNSICRGC